MANIATIFAAAVRKPDFPRGRVTAHGLFRAMTRYFGQSYCVTPWTYDDYPNGFIYTQHGEKWSPTGVEDAWKRFGRWLEEIYVRWFDGGGDHDQVFRFAGEFVSQSLCRYGFDMIRLTAAEEAQWPAIDPRWEPTGTRQFTLRLEGSYLSGNDRCDIPLGCIALPSRTTPVLGHGVGSARNTTPTCFYWKSDELPDSLTLVEPFVWAEAVEVEFFWRGRVVRKYQRAGDWWYSWNLDDWDNCLDPDWLACVARQNMISNHRPDASASAR